MFFWILFIITALIWLGGLAAAILGRSKAGVAVAAGGVVLSGIVFASFSATTVDARAVGIQTSFGKYVDTLDNGFQWTAPWSSVEEFSTQIQELKLEVPVSFEGGSSGTANVTLLWAINGPEAKELWQDHRTFDRVQARVVKPTAQTEIAAAFSAYQPQDARDGKNRSAQQEAIKTALSGENNNGGVLEGRGILVDAVQVTNVTLGERAQNSVDRVAEAESNTIRAQEEQERAKIEAETNRIRQQSQTPEALQRYCLEVVNNWDVEKNGHLPATFNCVLTGSNTPVIVGP